jgi:hypothetical protein
MDTFDCKDCGDIEEYVGCKIVRTKNSLKFTQPVLMQSYSDKFELPKKRYRTPALAGLVLVAGKIEEALSPAMQKKYCSLGLEKPCMQCSTQTWKPTMQCKICLTTCTRLRRITTRPCYVYLSTVWIQLNRA